MNSLSFKLNLHLKVCIILNFRWKQEKIHCREQELTDQMQHDLIQPSLKRKEENVVNLCGLTLWFLGIFISIVQL